MPNQKIGNPSFTQYDGVYVDSVNGDFYNLDDLIAGTIAGGPFVIGEPVVAAPSGATGNIVAQDAGSITVCNIVGVFTLADTITAAGSGASIGTLTSITAPYGATGTPNNPVSNLTDALAIAQSRNLTKLILTGARDFTRDYTASHNGTTGSLVLVDTNAQPFKPGSLVGLYLFNDTDHSSGVITANDEYSITAVLTGGTNNFWTIGDLYEITIDAGETQQPYALTFDTNTDITLVGHPLYDITVSPGIVVNFTGDVVCGSLTNTTGEVDVEGYLKVLISNINRGMVKNTTGVIFVAGNCDVSYIDNGLGYFTIVGNCTVISDISNSGPFTINGNLVLPNANFNNNGTVDIGGNFIGGGSNITNGINNFTIYGNCVCGGIIGTSGSFFVDGDLRVFGNTSINPGGTVQADGDCQLGGVLMTGGNFVIWNSCDVDGSFQANVNGVSIIIGDCHIQGDLLLGNGTSGSATINGDCSVDGSTTVAIGASLVVGGIGRFWGTVNNAGTITCKNVDVRMVSTTIDLNQAASDYDLFTGTAGVVELNSLVITMPNAVAGGALTSISIQTNDATPQVLIDNTTGGVANLTAEAQLAWQGKVRLGVGKKIQLTINGGPEGGAYVCDVDVEFKSLASAGYLA